VVLYAQNVYLHTWLICFSSNVTYKCVHEHVVFLSFMEDSEKTAVETEWLQTINGNDALVSASSNCVEDLQTCKDLEDLENMGYSVQVLEKSLKEVLWLKL